MTSDVGPLLSSVSLMLAAFGFFYTTQRDRIDAVIDDADIPDPGSARTKKLKNAERARQSATFLCLAALVIWILLLDEILNRIRLAFDQHLDLDRYSTENVIFFVAANAWLCVAIYIAARWLKLNQRVKELRLSSAVAIRAYTYVAGCAEAFARRGDVADERSYPPSLHRSRARAQLAKSANRLRMASAARSGHRFTSNFARNIGGASRFHTSRAISKAPLGTILSRPVDGLAWAMAQVSPGWNGPVGMGDPSPRVADRIRHTRVLPLCDTAHHVQRRHGGADGRRTLRRARRSWRVRSGST